MTEEEIKKIARGYWDSQNPTNKLKDHPEAKMIVDAMQSVLSGPIDELVEDYTKFLTWMLRDYCIVPKVEILNQHAWYMQRMKEVSSNRQMNRGKAIALEYLFGKEMFEEARGISKINQNENQEAEIF